MTTYFKQGLDVTGNVNLTGNITVGGDQNFGDANTDSITFTADITSNIVPDVSNTYDLGLTGQRWRTLYGKDLNLDGNGDITGNLTVDGTLSTTTGNLDIDGDGDISGNLNVDGILSSTSGDLQIQAPANIALYPTDNIWISQGTKLIFEGTSPDDFEVKLQATTVTADRDIIFPDAAGTVAVSATAPVTLSATGDIGVDATVVTTTGTQTLTNKTLGAVVGTVDQLTAAGAIDITTYITEITTTAATAYTLADGVLGQIKIISLIVDGGDATITPTTFATGTTITLGDVNDNITLLYTTNGWANTANQGAIIA
jgi:cytoskeletal protein CcmA (bactofilin family)